METKQMRARVGFTLVEMLISITVLGTVAAMGLPRVNSTIRQQRVIAASNALAGDIESAFSVAARQRKPVRILYDSPSGEIRVIDRAALTIYSRRPLGLTSEYHLDAVSIAPATVDVYPVGLASAAFTVTLTNGAFQRRVIVTRTGLTRVRP
jgi:prepilin-type N-terminal cleavage/methylation domain-containing protein